MSHFLAKNPSKSNNSEKHVETESDQLFKPNNDLKKTLYTDNSAKQSFFNSPRPDKNLVIQPSLPSPVTKPVYQNEEKSSPLVLKSTKKPNSFVIVKKENNTPILNDPTKVIVIRSRNKNKSKFIMQKPLEPVVKKELPDVPPRKEDGLNLLINRTEVKNKQNQLPELYSCEKMPPSPTSEYIDVEDLVATFTPNISFEEVRFIFCFFNSLDFVRLSN